MSAETLSSAAITGNLGTRLIGRRAVYYPSVTSTMDLAREEAQRRAPEGTVVVTGEQTAGRGRLGRIWQSPGGSIALSVVLYPEVVRLPSLIMVASLAVVHSIEFVTALKPRIKWPNDVLIADRKVCGILVESQVRGNVADYSLIGIGVNVNLNPADLGGVVSQATSLARELGHEVSRLEIVRQLLIEMDRWYLSLLAGESVYEEWRDKLVTLGKQVTVTWGETRCEGIAESVDRDGSLLLRGADGSLTRIVAGDVTLRQ